MRPAQTFDPAKYIKVGWVKDAHGIKGELYIQLQAETADWLDDFEEFWLTPRSNASPPKHFKVKRARPHKVGLVISTEEIKDRTEAETFKGASFFISKELLESDPGETIFLHEILDFQILDKEIPFGVITGFSTNGVQDLLEVKSETSGETLLIPFVEAFIVDIDFDKKQITMDLPPGIEDQK